MEVRVDAARVTAHFCTARIEAGKIIARLELVGVSAGTTLALEVSSMDDARELFAAASELVDCYEAAVTAAREGLYPLASDTVTAVDLGDHAQPAGGLAKSAEGVRAQRGKAPDAISSTA